MTNSEREESRKEIEKYKCDISRGIPQCQMVLPRLTEYGYSNCALRENHPIDHRDFYGSKYPSEMWISKEQWEKNK